MKVKDLINILDKYKDYEVGLWDYDGFLDIFSIEEYPNNVLGINGSYSDCDYMGIDISTSVIDYIYEKE